MHTCGMIVCVTQVRTFVANQSLITNLIYPNCDVVVTCD